MGYVKADVESWIAHDPDLETRAEITALLTAAEAGDSEANAELSDRFQGLLQFGTAGLRGAMAGGPFRMNRAVVRKAAAGLSAWLKRAVGGDALVVIGYDARYHSQEFAQDTAAIVTAAGLRAKLMPRALPTPLLAGAVRYFGADAGVMVTASHNPKWDNGYKVYVGGRAVEADGNGVQIVPPIDREIAEAIAAAPHADEIELAQAGWEIIGEEYVDWYIAATADCLPSGESDVLADMNAFDSAVRDAGTADSAKPSPGECVTGERETLSAIERAVRSSLKIVYTPMHGVGAGIMLKVLESAGFTDVTTVPEQVDPDPEFPTVSFPNPEETGALDLSIALAQRIEADIVIASDPDADRTSAAVPCNPENPSGRWRQLSGDEIGSLLGECVASSAEAAGLQGNMASSIVSSRLLREIAADHGLGYVPTLTGFKWIARAPEILFGYEEAIGFCVNPKVVKDKDGLSGGVLLAWLAAHLKAQGKDLLGDLDRLARVHGVYLTAPVTIRVDDLSIIPATMAHLRENPPAMLAGSPVASIVDLSDAVAAKEALGVPPTDAIMIHTQANDRVIVRPSGTEPKVKCYLEVIVPVDHADESDTAKLMEAKACAAKRLERFKADMGEALKLP